MYVKKKKRFDWPDIKRCTEDLWCLSLILFLKDRHRQMMNKVILHAASHWL